MKRFILKGLTVALASAFVLTSGLLTACKPEDVTQNGEVSITFWGTGDENETAVFSDLVNQFNELYKGQIRCNYDPRPSDHYTEALTAALRATRARVDVVYIEDANLKSYATLGYLEPLDRYIRDSREIVIEDMWETSVNRYLYDVNTTTQDGPDAHYWGVPKDIGPTVIFYNETQFNQAGVNVISVAAEDLDDFNSGAPDARGQTKAALGINGTVKEKGYFELDGKKWFNNQVPMSWEECRTLATLVMQDQRANHNRPKHYGYFTEWWFNYGWSVGGDCVEYVPSDDPQYNGGYWDFTLMEDTPNYIVADDAQPFTVNGTTYQPGQILAWGDKLVDPASSEKTIRPEVLAAKESGQLNELPSQRDAFVEFLRVGQNSNVEIEGVKGYNICPSPEVIGGDAGKTVSFASGDLAMLVDGRWNVVNFRKLLGSEPGKADLSRGQFEWDVCPLPMYKEYDEEGNITVHGVEAGHSGSVCVAINAKSQKKDAAWKFIEYIGGKTGQEAQAKSGFAIPSQKELAMRDDVFLQTSMNPRNSIVFVRYAEIETPGDWWYLRDKLWIDPWAGILNGSVRNGKMTLAEFEKDQNYLRTFETLKDYTRK